jgi:hypothetical protein
MTDGPCVVIDTNAWAVAEGMHDGASEDCMRTCLGLLNQVDSGVQLAVDEGDRIFTEYLATLRASHTAGLAVKLAERLYRTRWGGVSCKLICITPLSDPAGSFAEVPETVRDFDVDDQKFLAVAAAEGNTPPIFQALDREWWDRRTDLAAAGFDVQFLCAADLVGATS